MSFRRLAVICASVFLLAGCGGGENNTQLNQANVKSELFLNSIVDFYKVELALVECYRVQNSSEIENEVKFTRVLKKEIKSKYEQAKSEINLFMGMITPLLRNNAFFPYLWYRNELRLALKKLNQMHKKFESDQVFNEKLSVVIQKLNFIEDNFDLFDDQLFSENRDYVLFTR